MTGADESEASWPRRGPDVTGLLYNMFNAVMTETAAAAPALFWRTLLEPLLSHSKSNAHVIAIIFRIINMRMSLLQLRRGGKKESRWTLPMLQRR